MEILKKLVAAVVAMSKALPAEQAKKAAEDLSRFVEEATNPKPNKKWYSASTDGLIKAAENLGTTTIRGVQINCAVRLKTSAESVSSQPD
jgi:hypothetical protein